MGQQPLCGAISCAAAATGKIAGTWGRKRAFLTGLTIFVEGSVLAGFLPPPPLTSARAVQAIGAAFIMPSTLSTVNAVFRGKYRAAAFGVWGAVISGSAALGLLAGGALTEWVSWYSRLSRPDLGWWEPQSSFSFFGWTWSENAPISPVPVALAVSAVGFALSAMAIGAFSPVQQPPRRGTVRGRLAPCSSGSAWKPSAFLSSSRLWGRIRMVGSSPHR